MPLVAFKCPDPKMWGQDPDDFTPIKAVPVQICLDCSLSRADRECPYDFADIFIRADGESSYTGGFYSPSRFNGCDRELFLKEKFAYWADPKEMTYKVRGTQSHAKLEVNDPRVIGEARVYRILYNPDGSFLCVVAVQPDKIYPTLAQIHDDKTYKYLPVDKGKPVEQPIKKENVRQLSVGAWAWRDPLAVRYRDGTWVHRPTPIEITTGQIIIRDGKNALRQWGIRLDDDAELEEWMRYRSAEIKSMIAGRIPGYCEPEKRWRCPTCPVRYLCGISDADIKAGKDSEGDVVKYAEGRKRPVRKPERPAETHMRRGSRVSTRIIDD